MNTPAMLLISLILASGLLFGQSNNRNPALGAKASSSCLKQGAGRAMLTHTSQLRPFCEVTADNVTYSVAFRFKDRRIVHIHTRDVDFKTANGLRVGSEIEVKKEDFYIIPQVEIRTPVLGDGWEPVVGSDDEGSENKPNFVDKLASGELVKVRIIGFSKGSN